MQNITENPDSTTNPEVTRIRTCLKCGCRTVRYVPTWPELPDGEGIPADVADLEVSEDD